MSSKRVKVWIGYSQKSDWTQWPSYPTSCTIAQVLSEILARSLGMVEYPLTNGGGKKIICTTEYHEVKVDSLLENYVDKCINYDSNFYVHFEAV